MLKRTLVSSAIIAALSLQAQAADLDFIDFPGDTDDVVISYEGSKDTAAYSLPEIEIYLEANYVNNDLLVISFTSDLDPALRTGELSVDLDSFDSGIEIESINFETNSITLRVVSEGNAETFQDSIFLSGVRLDVAALRALDPDEDGYRYANMTFNSFRGSLDNEILDSEGNSYATDLEDVDLGQDMVIVAPQFTGGSESGQVVYADTVGTRSLDSTWSNFRMNDSLNSEAANNIIKIDLDTETLSDDITELSATVESITHTIVGDFTNVDGVLPTVHFDDPSLTELGEDDVEITVNATSMVITVTHGTLAPEAVATPADANYDELDREDAFFDLVVNFNGSGVGIGAGAYTVDSEVTYTTADGEVAAESSSFEDTAEFDVAYLGKRVVVRSMPFGSNIDPFLWVSNGASVDALAQFEIVYGGETYGPFYAGEVAANSNTRISDSVMSAALASGITFGRGDIIITLTENDEANAPLGGSSIIGEYEGTPWYEENFGEDLATTSATTYESGLVESSYAVVSDVNDSLNPGEDNVSSTMATSDNDQFTVGVEVEYVNAYNVYAGYKVIGDADRLNLPVEVLSDGVDSNTVDLGFFIP